MSASSLTALCSGTARIITGAHDIQVPEPPTARGLDALGIQTSRTKMITLQS
ncbi:MAG: hypothetical protein QM602_01460 [Microbacterium sp.]